MVWGQPRVIIWTNLVVLEYPMLYTKFQGHLPFGSREEYFNVFIIYGHGGYLGHVIKFEQNFVPPSQGGLASIGSAVIQEKKFENIESEWLGPRSLNDLDRYWKAPCTHLVDLIFQLDIIDYNSFWKIHCFTFYSIQKHSGPNLTLP